MKSTEKLIDNLMNNDFRKAKIDLEHACNTIVKKRIHEKKKDFLKQLNEK